MLLPFTAWELTQPGLTQWGLHAMTLVLIVAIVPGLAAYWIYGWAQRVIGASRVAVSLYLGPLYGAVAAWLLLGERGSWKRADFVGMTGFGASAPAPDLYRHFGITAEAVATAARNLIEE